MIGYSGYSTWNNSDNLPSYPSEMFECYLLEGEEIKSGVSNVERKSCVSCYISTTKRNLGRRVLHLGRRVGIAPFTVSTHSLTAALDQLRVMASSTSNDLGLRSGQHQQTGQCLLPLVAAKFFVDDPADASSQRRGECQCVLLLTVAVPAKQVCSQVGDRCDRIMNVHGSSTLLLLLLLLFNVKIIQQVYKKK